MSKAIIKSQDAVMKKREITRDFDIKLDQYVLLNMQDWLSERQIVTERQHVDERTKSNLEVILAKPQYTFQEQLFHLIDVRELKDVEVYKKAQIDRKLFSRIRCNKDYKPKRSTAISLIMALELDIYEAEELLKLAGLALSTGVRSDLIIRFCIMNGMYDIDRVNEILYRYGESTLGD